MRKCSDMNYHYGMILKIYPSDQQKRPCEKAAEECRRHPWPVSEG